MKFLLNPIGSLGDVNPYVGLGLELRTRGHEVTVIANPHFESLITGQGLNFVAMGTIEDVQAYWRDPDMWRESKSWQISLKWSALRPMRQSYELISKRYVPGETVVVAPSWAFGARIAQEKWGVPLATLYLAPDRFRSMIRSPVMPLPMVLSDWVPRISKRFQFWIADRFFIDPIVAPETNKFRAELGLPPLKRLLQSWWESPQRIVGLFPDWFGLPQNDWPPQTVVTSFPLWDQSATREVPEDVLRFLEGGDPPVVFTFGTANQHTRRCFEVAVETCRQAGRRGMLISNTRDYLPERLPDGVKQFSYVPFSKVLPSGTALVHHAGTGTAAQALLAGVPQVVCPFAFVCPGNAREIVRLGVAESFRPGSFTSRNVCAALDRLTSSPQTAARCKELADDLKQSDGIGRTCDVLEQMAGTDRPADGKATGRFVRIPLEKSIHQ